MIETLILLLLNNIFMIITITAIYNLTIRNRTPVKVVKEIIEKREEKRIEKEEKAIERANLENIDNYNGSAEGQKKIK